MTERIRVRLGFPRDAGDALARLCAIEPAPGAFALPGAEETRERLEMLGVSADAVGEIVEATPSERAHPEAWWLLERMHHELCAESADPLWWPAPEPCDDALLRYLQLYVFLAALPAALRLHEERGVPSDVSRATLRDVAMAVEGYRQRNGRPGFDNAFWLAQHFRARIFQLGRLQFNFWRVVFDPGPDAGFEEGDPALGVHIPALGPLTPDACDRSIAYAGEFFPRHFPEREPYRIATCGSWLLDPQLSEYLPETSNIIRFQRRFTPAPGWWLPGDEDVMRFVFGRVPESIEALPQRTTLERAVVEHLKAGRHWQVRNGWLEL